MYALVMAIVTERLEVVNVDMVLPLLTVTNHLETNVVKASKETCALAMVFVLLLGSVATQKFSRKFQVVTKVGKKETVAYRQQLT